MALASIIPFMTSLTYSRPRSRPRPTDAGALTVPGDTATARATEVTDSAWHAIIGRDATADGDFVYGVQTTGIDCRPSCSSRQPHRHNVRIFAAGADAELAGYRPCKRCEPQKLAAEGEVSRGAATSMVQRACAYIDANPQGSLRLADIARAAHASPGHLQRTFTRILGISPRAYAEAKRQERLRQALREGRTVSSAVYDAGYGSSRPVYGPVDAPAPLGMPPATYQAGGAGAVHPLCHHRRLHRTGDGRRDDSRGV